MEFFVDNWFWFLVVGIVVLMTLIGYIAEKTDFGRKDVPKKEKTKKVKKVNKAEKQKEGQIEVLEVENTIEENTPEVQISLATDSIFENNQSMENMSTIEEIPEELKAPFGNLTFDNLKIENESNSIDIVQNSQSNVEDIVLQAPIEELKVDDVHTSAIELPDLNTIVDTEDNGDNDDVWKF